VTRSLGERFHGRIVGSERHVQALIRECQANQCDPLGLARSGTGVTVSTVHRSEEVKLAAKRLGIAEFYARRIALLWEEDPATSVQVGLMVGLFAETISAGTTKPSNA
jgi:hypothetical protein